jgi:hypothetical protein
MQGTDQEAHDEELRAIAEQSTEWVSQHGSWDHHLAYMYRLLLEWARVISDERDQMDFTYKGE